MHINLNKKNEGEMVFSWKEVWILIKKRKLTFGTDFLDRLIISLLRIKAHIKEINEQKNPK